MYATPMPSTPTVASAPPASHESRRVASHIRRAELAARATETRALDPLRRLVRALLLDELADYRRRGTFPKNRDFAEQTPYFVDADGTRCAMAHLLEIGGESELVARIARERNNAYVRELADEPRLLAWLAAAGMTVAEAAAIQPSYCDVLSHCACGGGFSNVEYPVPATGVLEGVVRSVVGGVTVRIDRIHGQAGPYAVGESVAVAVRPLSPDLFVSAVLSSDCNATLAAADAVWQGSSCRSTGEGCAAAGGSAPTTLGVLLAIVAVLAARGRRRARKRG